jgi:hypothetical protein
VLIERRKKDRLMAGRSATRPAAFFLAYLLAETSAVAHSQPLLERQAPIPQAFDDDCGVAALAMLFRNAGVEISIGRLVAGLSVDARGEALSGTDLIQMVRNSGEDFELVAGFVPVASLHELAAEESFIILLRPRSFGGADGFDHFVVVERRLAAGYLIADPILPSRTLLADALVERDAHGKMVNGVPYVMVFRLIRDGKPAMPLRQSTADERARSWSDTYRLPRSLPSGKWLVETNVVHTTSSEVVDDGVEIDSEGLSKRVRLSRGVGHSSQASVELVENEGSTRLQIPGAALSLGSEAGRSASVDWTKFYDWDLPLQFAASTNLRAAWSNRLAPDAVSGSIQLTNRLGDVGMSISNELVVDLRMGKAALFTTVSASLDVSTPWDVIVGGIATLESQNMQSPDRLFATAYIAKNIDPNLSISAFVQHDVLQRHGRTDTQVGVTLTFGVPRPMR